MNIVVVIPTYNERQNIAQLLKAVEVQQNRVKGRTLSILVVDDNSPDGTGEIVKNIVKENPHVHLLEGEKEGLGAAYIRGFEYVLEHLHADVVIQMDADFSHNPNDIPRLLDELDKGYSIVIGSRYVTGGELPTNWSVIRKLGSKVGNAFARFVTDIPSVKDCTGGFRAIRTALLTNIPLHDMSAKGYVFQVALLSEATKQHAIISEIPIRFVDRMYGQSKLTLHDVSEFVFHVVAMRLKDVPVIYFAALPFLGFGMILVLLSVLFGGGTVLTSFIVFVSFILILQSAFTIYWMIYAWEHPERIEKNGSPKTFDIPQKSFTALIPARQEADVISQTIEAISSIDYPERLKEAIIICRSDDKETIEKVQQSIREIGKDNISLAIFDGEPINKPHGLNIGLARAKNDVVVVFDAEDEAHSDIYNVVNTVMRSKQADVVQSGVQLMNYNSRWFSALNVLEYFFWFKSTLQYFARQGSIPLGGNTVFFKRSWLEKLGGWDETCLTEDADIGIRMSSKGARITTVYDESHVTREETPMDVSTFIRQRTRWNQGFLQILLKGDWARLPTYRQKLLALYILLWPHLQALLFFYLPISIILVLTLNVPVYVAIIANVPLLLFVIQITILNIGLWEFTKGYGYRYSFLSPFRILFTFFPFQLLLGFSSFRALFRMVVHKNTWEKTAHVNAHREKTKNALDLNYVTERL